MRQDVTTFPTEIGKADLNCELDYESVHDATQSRLAALRREDDNRGATRARWPYSAGEPATLDIRLVATRPSRAMAQQVPAAPD